MPLRKPSPHSAIRGHQITLTLGLLVGKQLGVFLSAAAVIRLGWAELPMYTSWRQLYGVALLCGVGFTMSLFIGLLAFPTSPTLQNDLKMGVLVGSVVSALVGAALLWTTRPRVEAPRG